MYGLPGDVVRAIEPHTESDPVALLIHQLVYFGNAVGRNAYTILDGANHYANIYAGTVGQSAKSRKGTAERRIRNMMRLVDHDWAEQRIQSGLSSGEGLIWTVRDPIYKIKKGESVLDDEGIADHRVLFHEGEFFGVLTVMTRGGNTLSSVMRNAWDGHDILQTITKNSPAKSTGAHVSIVGHITEDELRQHLDHTSLLNGFANRFVFVLVKRSKSLPFGGGDMDAANSGGAAPYLAKIASTLSRGARSIATQVLRENLISVLGLAVGSGTHCRACASQK
jgi:hypothetical protein